MKSVTLLSTQQSARVSNWPRRGSMMVTPATSRTSTTLRVWSMGSSSWVVDSQLPNCARLPSELAGGAPEEEEGTQVLEHMATVSIVAVSAVLLKSPSSPSVPKRTLYWLFVTCSHCSALIRWTLGTLVSSPIVNCSILQDIIVNVGLFFSLRECVWINISSTLHWTLRDHNKGDFQKFVRVECLGFWQCVEKFSWQSCLFLGWRSFEACKLVSVPLALDECFFSESLALVTKWDPSSHARYAIWRVLS